MLHHDSWLVQRLTKTHLPLKEPKEAWKLTADGRWEASAKETRDNIHGYDYMGSSEFEWGAVPLAMKGLVRDAKNLITYELQLPVYWEPFLDSEPLPPKETQPVYLLCRKDDLEEVVGRVGMFLRTPYNRLMLKESLMLEDAYSIREGYKEPRLVGWLELNNGYYFFSNRTVWRYMTKLYTGKLPK